MTGSQGARLRRSITVLTRFLAEGTAGRLVDESARKLEGDAARRPWLASSATIPQREPGPIAADERELDPRLRGAWSHSPPSVVEPGVQGLRQTPALRSAPMPRLTPADLAEWRRQLFEEGDGEWLDPSTAQEIAPRLMAEVEALWAERDAARLEALREAAGLLEGRLAGLARRGPPGADGSGCVHCHDAEARWFATALRARAS